MRKLSHEPKTSTEAVPETQSLWKGQPFPADENEEDGQHEGDERGLFHVASMRKRDLKVYADRGAGVALHGSAMVGASARML